DRRRRNHLRRLHRQGCRCHRCPEARRLGGTCLMRALCLILVLVALAPQARAQPLSPDQACSEIVKTLDRITGHRDSNQEAVRRGFIACRLFPTRSSPPPSGNVMDEIEPNPRGITRSEVEQAVAEWCQTHADAAQQQTYRNERGQITGSSSTSGNV